MMFLDAAPLANSDELVFGGFYVFDVIILVVLILLCLFLWRKMKKATDILWKKLFAKLCILMGFSIVEFCVMKVLIFSPQIRFRIDDTTISKLIIGISVLAAVLAFVFYFILRRYYLEKDKDRNW